MRSLGTRRAALGMGVAAVAAMALTGCGSGQIAETAKIVPATDGVNTTNSDSSVAIRNLVVAYPGTKGYPSGGSAPLELGIFNRTAQPLTVSVTSTPPAGAAAEKKAGVVAAQSVSLVGAGPSAATSGIPGSAEPTGTRSAPTPQVGTSAEVGQPTVSASVPPEPSVNPTATPAAGAGQPAKITMAAFGSATFRAGDPQSLQVVGLSGPLQPGNSVNLVFTFSNGAEPLIVQAPVAIPLSPAPRGSSEIDGISEEEGH
jgi:hypothetical protein